jgi:hypothetical protein
MNEKKSSSYPEHFIIHSLCGSKLTHKVFQEKLVGCLIQATTECYSCENFDVVSLLTTFKFASHIDAFTKFLYKI